MRFLADDKALCALEQRSLHITPPHRGRCPAGQALEAGLFHRFPIHAIKIDRAFILEIEHAQALVVLTVISIARRLGLNLMAEGVETPAQVRHLEKSGRRIVQGYHHQPMRLNSSASR